jgi:ketosteroid isomerase-like protein
MNMKKLMNIFTTALMLLAILSTSTLMGQEWSKEQKEVWKEVKSGWEAWSKGDTDGAFNSIHDKYLGWNNDDPLPMSKQKWMDTYNKYKDYMTVDHYDLSPARILVEGDNAVVYYYFEFHTTYKKGDKEKSSGMEGRNVEFYVKDNGKWMLFGDMTYIDDDDD